MATVPNAIEIENELLVVGLWVGVGVDVGAELVDTG
jgi:hypothetical protein